MIGQSVRLLIPDDRQHEEDDVLGRFHARSAARVGHTMIGNLGGPMAVLMPATLASAVPVNMLLSDWLSIRNRWEAFHAARTFISLAGFGFALAAALCSREDATPPV